MPNHESRLRQLSAPLLTALLVPFALAVKAQVVNSPPQFQNVMDYEAPEGEALGFYAWARDPEGDAVSYDIQGVPAFGTVVEGFMGDVDVDGFVTQGDVAVIDDHVTRRGRRRFDAFLDLNNDGSVDLADVNLARSLVSTQELALFVSLDDPTPGTFDVWATATDEIGGSSMRRSRIVILDLGVLKTYATHKDVLLVVNDNAPVSVDIANYFAEARKIPENHVVHITAPAKETVTSQEFTDTIRVPIEEFLTSTGVLDEINYIVTTKGVPLRVAGSQFTRASVDSELTLILGPYANRIGSTLFNNPVANSEFPFSRKTHGVFLVTRLTGYSYADVVQMIDNAGAALEGRHGKHRGRAFSGQFVFDVDPGRDGGGFKIGNDWLRAAAVITEAAGYEALLDETSTFVTGETDVLGYASWGSNDANDTNHAIPGFRWLPGALAETFVSTSARSFSLPPNYGQSLIADLIAEGVTGAKGYVYEPFLDAVAHPDILFDRYIRGFNLADSYYMASAFMSWMDVVVGDPKTRISTNVEDEL